MISYYSQHSEKLTKQYESVRPELVNKEWAEFIPKQKSMILDIGAGSGRDSAWMASMGHDVTAVEPAEQLREKAQKNHSSSSIRWMSDTLPDLNLVYDLCRGFDLILVNAVWMHIPPEIRETAFRKIHGLLKPGGKLVISLRHGPSPDERKMYPVSCEEIRTLAEQYVLDVLLTTEGDDKLGRKEVSWSTLVLLLPR